MCLALHVTIMRRHTAVVVGGLVLSLLSLVATACGEASPTAASQSVPAPPAIVPVPPSEAPNLLGEWAGIYTIATVDRGTGLRSSNTCSESWRVNLQTRGQFSGTFQLSPGTTITCAQSGTFFGTVSATGALSALSHSVPLASLPCARISGDGTMTGTASPTALAAQATDTVRCTNILTYETDRSLALVMTKR